MRECVSVLTRGFPQRKHSENYIERQNAAGRCKCAQLPLLLRKNNNSGQEKNLPERGRKI